MAIQPLLAFTVTEMLMAVDCIYYARVSPTALLTEEEGIHTGKSHCPYFSCTCKKTG